jgi:predicted transcriptional regulator of viral defense system
VGGHHEIAQLASSQLGLVRHAQAVELGMTERQIRYRVESGLWERVSLGVVRLRGAPQSREQALLAACFAIGPEAAVSHRSAATVLGLLRYRESLIEVTTTRRRSPEVRGVTVHRLADLHPRWVEAVDGIPTTTVARTLVDIGAVAPSDGGSRSCERCGMPWSRWRARDVAALAHFVP